MPSIFPASGLEIDDAAQRTTISNAETSRYKVNAAGELTVDDSSKSSEVVKLRDLMTVEVDATVIGGRSSYDEKTCVEWGSCHTRKILDHLQWVSLGTWQHFDFLLADALFVDLPLFSSCFCGCFEQIGAQVPKVKVVGTRLFREEGKNFLAFFGAPDPDPSSFSW